jgi:hypothetical protein
MTSEFGKNSNDHAGRDQTIDDSVVRAKPLA